MKRSRIIVSTLALTAALPLFLGAGTAQAATYDNVDPTSTSCANTASTVKSASLVASDGTVVGSIELRYSSACRTVWARVNGSGYRQYDSAGPGGEVIRNSDGKTLSTIHCNSSHSSCYSNMLNDAGVTSYARGFISHWAYGRVGPVRTGNY